MPWLLSLILKHSQLNANILWRTINHFLFFTAKNVFKSMWCRNTPFVHWKTLPKDWIWCVITLAWKKRILKINGLKVVWKNWTSLHRHKLCAKLQMGWMRCRKPLLPTKAAVTVLFLPDRVQAKRELLCTVLLTFYGCNMFPHPPSLYWLSTVWRRRRSSAACSDWSVLLLLPLRSWLMTVWQCGFWGCVSMAITVNMAKVSLKNGAGRLPLCFQTTLKTMMVATRHANVSWQVSAIFW